MRAYILSSFDATTLSGLLHGGEVSFQRNRVVVSAVLLEFLVIDLVSVMHSYIVLWIEKCFEISTLFSRLFALAPFNLESYIIRATLSNHEWHCLYIFHREIFAVFGSYTWNVRNSTSIERLNLKKPDELYCESFCHLFLPNESPVINSESGFPSGSIKNSL